MCELNLLLTQNTKIMKKLYSLLLVVAATLFSTNVNAALPQVGDQMYMASNNIIVEVTEFKNTSALTEMRLMVVGFDEEAPIADTLRLKYVNAWKNATEITIPANTEQTSGGKTQRIVFEGVKNKAYWQHQNLKKITIQQGGDETFTVQGQAFSSCPNLESVTFGYHKKIELLGSCFYNCPKLAEVKFPDQVPQSGINLFASCFEGCTSLDLCKVNLKGVKQIWSHAFKNTATGSDEAHSTLVLPSIQKLGTDILKGTQVTALELDGQGTIETTADKAMESPFYSIRKQLDYVSIMDGDVTGLGDYLFWGAENAYFEMNTVTSYGKHSMEGCKEFASNGIYLYGPDVTNIGDSAFFGIEATKVYLPANVPTMGKEVFGAMSDGFTLFIINGTNCDDELAELYMLEDENENLWTPYKEGRLVYKGTKVTPKFDEYIIRNATEAASSQSGYSYGKVTREPVCGMDNVEIYVHPKAGYYALNDDKDTLQWLPLSHFEYNGLEYYPNTDGMVYIPLASDASLKITPVYMPKLITEVNIQVGVPQMSDPTDCSNVEVILPEGALYSVKYIDAFNSEGNNLDESYFKGDTDYQVRIALEPDFVRAAFPWETTNTPDLNQITTLINGTPADEVKRWNNGTIALIRYFHTSNLPHAIDNVEAGKDATKILRDGQLIIIRDGKEYNAQGAQL